MELEHKIFRMDKSLHDEEDDGPDFKGILSVAGVKDLQEDVIDEGAFKRTLDHHKGRVPLLIDHDHRNRLGVAVLKEVGKKLQLSGFVNKAKQMAVDTLSDIKFSLAHEVPLGLSIGFETIKDEVVNGVRHIKEVHLWEGSVVTFPANLKARVTAAKAAATVFGDLPVDAGFFGWNAKAADGKIVALLAPQGPFPDNEEDYDKYRSCHVLYDKSDPGNCSAYKLLIADVADGKLVARPEALMEAALELRQLNLPEAERKAAEEHIERYFAKMGMPSPFDGPGKFIVDTYAVLAYAEKAETLSDGEAEVKRAFIERAAKALNALLGPTDAEIDSLAHSIYSEESEAKGLSEKDDEERAAIRELADHIF